MKRLLLTAMTVLLLSVGTASAESFEDGIEAFNRGDYATAIKWFRQSAALGDASAQFSLGAMYENGQGVAQDYAEAIKWFRLAADQGYANAQSNLGLMYAKGEGVSNRVQNFPD